jgi:lipoprotein signal peptidase
MVKTILFYILSILGFIVLLYIGMKLSKIKNMKIMGYVLIFISALGLLIDLYNVIHNYIL